MSEQQSYYERVTKPKRQREREEKMARLGVKRLVGGSGRKYGDDFLEAHLKFSGDLARFIHERSVDCGKQAFFDMLVQQEFDEVMRRKSVSPGKTNFSDS